MFFLLSFLDVLKILPTSFYGRTLWRREYYSYNGAQSDNNASVSVSDKNSSKTKKKKSTMGKSGGAVAAPVKLSTDPQSVAARERRHRISERFKTLQRLVPGGAKLDTVSMLDEAIHYVKFLKTQIWLHETLISCGSVSALADAYSEPFQQQPHLDGLYRRRSIEWSQSSVDDGAALAAGQSSLGHDMAEVQFGYETTLF